MFLVTTEGRHTNALGWQNITWMAIVKTRISTCKQWPHNHTCIRPYYSQKGPIPRRILSMCNESIRCGYALLKACICSYAGKHQTCAYFLLTQWYSVIPKRQVIFCRNNGIMIRCAHSSNLLHAPSTSGTDRPMWPKPLGSEFPLWYPANSGSVSVPQLWVSSTVAFCLNIQTAWANKERENCEWSLEQMDANECGVQRRKDQSAKALKIGQDKK